MSADVEVIAPEATIREAAEKMKDLDVGPLPVCDGERLVGIFTDRDAVVKAAGKRIESFHVRDFMTPDPVVLRHDDPIAVAIHKMAIGGFRHIPILEDGRPTGAEALGEFWHDDARHRVDAAARGVRHDQGNRARRVALAERGGREDCAGKCNGEAYRDGVQETLRSSRAYGPGHPGATP